MAIFKTLTQGGQVHLHQLRMLKQVLFAGLTFSVVVGGGYFGWSFMKIPSIPRQMLLETYWAEMLILTVPEERAYKMTQNFVGPHGKTYHRSSLSILQDRQIQKQFRYAEAKTIEALWDSLRFTLWALLGLGALWFAYGFAQQMNHHKRGNYIVSWRTLRNRLLLTRKASDLKLGKMPLLKGSETSHMLLTGTTGTGKSNAFNILLPQIRKRGDRALIVDITGDFIERHYKPDRDCILNPFDVRSQDWSPWADCEFDAHYDVLANAIIQKNGSHRDPFWENASRAILKTALRKMKYQGIPNIKHLYEFLMYSEETKFDEYFQGTEAATFASKSNEKTTQSIRSTLATHLEGFRYLEDSPKYFSIREWVSETPPYDQGGWLFLTARPDQRSTLVPLISTWVDIAINALMVLPPDPNRRLWFVIDELAALQKLPCLQGGLAEGRKYGGCFLAGFQNKQQLEAIYDREEAAAMLDLFNTKAFFRCTEPNTQQWIAKVLGDKEAAESNESISFGANSMRDGVSLGRHIHQRSLVMPSELSLLENLHCYLKLPGDYPITQLKTPYQKQATKKQERFIIKPEKGRKYA